MIQALKKLHEQRIDGFLLRLRQMWYEDEVPLTVEYCVFNPMVPFERRLEGRCRPAVKGKAWGKDWDRAWFHLQGKIPGEWKEKNICARIDLGGEGLIFSADGMPLQALSVHTIWPNPDFRRDRFEISERAQGGEAVDLWIEASAGQLFGLKLETDRGNLVPEIFGRHEAAVADHCLAVFRKDIWDLSLDVFVLNNLMRALPEKSVRRDRILQALTRAADLFTGEPANVREVRDVLAPELAKKSSASDLETTAVGHAHLDTAWLWPIGETIRKCGRTFASQAGLIEKYPGYIFGASQAQHYAWVKEYYPKLYQKIKGLVASGRWEILGGMWVEADCNLIGGESMVRQILHGKAFFREEFGAEVRNLWLPDVFGYSASMPQVLQRSGLAAFVTQKMSWNQFNRLPHTAFRWRGIDGTEVVTHFPPEDNYNSELLPAALLRARENFVEHDVLDEFLTLFGIGDGGCGPTEEIIEAGLRQRDLEGSPRLRFGKAQEFLDRLAGKAGLLPVWSGELYFEYHRGTYTTQAYNKKMNRWMEHKLRELEILYAALPWRSYPTAELDRMWKVLLLNQFHDIIPGSSVTPVYEDSRKDYEGLRLAAQKLQEKAAGLLFKKHPDRLCLVNSLSIPYSRPVLLPESWAGREALDESGGRVPVQEENGRPVARVSIPALSALTLRRGKKAKPPTHQLPADVASLENDLVRYEFSDRGTLVRAFDKELGREVLSQGLEGNVLELYEDRPVNWDAWDIDIYYENQLRERARLVARQWISSGPVRKGMEMAFEIGRSKVVEKVYLAANSKRLDFETAVDWREDHKLLRVSFAVDVLAAEAAFEIQFGHVRRPTHRNTSWDMAKFEVVAHRYADLSDGDYGAALLNDSKYGHKILGNILSLCLLRAPTMPDPGADRGRHEFIYGFLPHSGDLAASPVLSEAAQLNQPPAVFEGYESSSFRFPFRLEGEDVILETVKKAEKGDAAVLRLYEPMGRHARAKLALGGNGTRVYETDLMEENPAALSMNKGTVELSFRPFEIKTLMVRRGRSPLSTRPGGPIPSCPPKAPGGRKPIGRKTRINRKKPGK